MRIISALKTINYRLWFAILAAMLLPTVYQTVRIFFLGDMPSDGGVNIASQLQWVNLFYEVVQEALILPLFFLLGKSMEDKNEFANKVRTGLIVTGGIYAVLSLTVIVSARPLIAFMGQDPALIDNTVTYVRLETLAALFATLWRFLFLVLVTLKKDGYMYLILAVQTALSVLLDVVLVSNLSVSAKLGVNGIACTNIIVNGTIFVIAIVLLHCEKIPVFAKEKLRFGWLKEWFRVVFGLGIAIAQRRIYVNGCANGKPCCGTGQLLACEQLYLELAVASRACACRLGEKRNRGK